MNTKNRAPSMPGSKLQTVEGTAHEKRRNSGMTFNDNKESTINSIEGETPSQYATVVPPAIMMKNEKFKSQIMSPDTTNRIVKVKEMKAEKYSLPPAPHTAHANNRIK